MKSQSGKIECVCVFYIERKMTQSRFKSWLQFWLRKKWKERSLDWKSRFIMKNIFVVFWLFACFRYFWLMD